MSANNDDAGQGHYRGLVVDWYDDFLAGEGEDIRLYVSLLAPAGGPLLELACGTGRLMLPFLRAGIEVDGIDLSGEMLGRCRDKLAAEGFTPTLSRQDIADFRMDRQYRGIFISGGSFQLLTTQDAALEALRAAHRHLLPGGRFVLDLVVGPDPFGTSDPKSWHIGRVAERGNERVVYSVRSTSDAFAQVSRLLTRYELFRDGRLVETILDELRLREYSRGEAQLLLERAGFNVESVEQRRVMSTHAVSALFVCRRP